MGPMRLRLVTLSALLASACPSCGSPRAFSDDTGLLPPKDAAGGDSSDALGPDANDAAPPGAGDAAPSPDSSGNTWAGWAMAFFAKYCVECHGASDPTGRDFTMQSVVMENKGAIRCGVCNVQDPSWGCPAAPHAQQFPITDSTGSNPKPTAAERDRVVAWITAGCP
jgi:hypothetical protein